jgi:hypothetical protein
MTEYENRLANIRAAIDKDRKDKEIRTKYAWEHLPMFIEPYLIPQLPQATEEEWKNYYVPKLIAAGAIPKDQLVDGGYYYGKHRCTNYGKWNAKDNVFNYWKFDIGGVYWDRCNHFEDDDHFALFVPIDVALEEEFDNSKLMPNGPHKTTETI